MNILETLKIQAQNPGACWSQNQWSETQYSSHWGSINPADGSTIAQIYTPSEQDYEKVLTQSQSAYLNWRTIPAPERGELVRRIGQRLRELKDPLGSLVALEVGKIKQEGDGEVQEMIDMADFAVGQSRMLYGKTMHSERPKHRMYEQWHPYGIIGVVSAFNFPVAVWAWNAFIAAICGNTVIWNPSPKAPLCAIAIQHICNEIMTEMGYQGIFSMLVDNEHHFTNKLAKDIRIPLISFTGSSAIGKKMNTTVAQRLGKTILELSGNNAIIIDATANLELAIPAIVFGAVGTAGQRCTTTRRLIIESSIYDDMVTRLINAYQQVSIGNPLDNKVLMGPLIDQLAQNRFLEVMNIIKVAGGNVLYGGKTLDQPGFFVMPTLIEAENHWDIVQQETFAPILYLMKYKHLDEAIQMQNCAPQGLSSALFSNHLQNIEHYLSSQGSDCGIANINIGTSGAEIGGAFGGEKETGGGREAGSDAWKGYMRRQTNTINWGSELPLAQGIQFDLTK